MINPKAPIAPNSPEVVSPWGFDIAETPLCWAEQTVLKRKGAKCELSGRRIEKGASVHEFRYFNGSFDIPTRPFVVLPEELSRSVEPKRNFERYEQDGYGLADFNFKTDYRTPDVCAFWQNLEGFHLETAMASIASPKTRPTPYGFLDVEGQRTRAEGSIHASTGGELIDLLWVLTKCGHASSVIHQLPRLPKYVSLLLMLFDRPAMRRAVSLQLGLPELVSIYEKVLKPRPTPKEIASLVRFGAAHPNFQKLLAQSLNLYEYHLASSYECSPNWFFWDFRHLVRGAGKNFLYLLATQADLVPALNGMKSRRELVDRPGHSVEGQGYRDSQPTFYETVLLHSALSDAGAYEFWAGLPDRMSDRPLLRKSLKRVTKVVPLLT